MAILRHLLSRYDDVVYRVHPSAQTVVTRSVKALNSGSERIMIRPYPPPTLAAFAAPGTAKEKQKQLRALSPETKR